MTKSKKEYSYKEMQNKGTGSHGEFENYKIIVYPFERYQIKIQLGLANEFMGVVEVKINKEFLSYNQKIKVQGSIDTSEDYPE